MHYESVVIHDASLFENHQILEENRLARLAWAHEHIHWTEALWTDETYPGRHRKTWVTRKAGEELKPRLPARGQMANTPVGGVVLTKITLDDFWFLALQPQSCAKIPCKGCAKTPCKGCAKTPCKAAQTRHAQILRRSESIG
jgi:hypothetical protein